MTVFCPKVLGLRNAPCTLFIDETYAHFYYTVENYSVLVAYTDIETETKSFSGIVSEGDYSRITLKIDQSLVSYYMLDLTVLPTDLSQRSNYIQNVASQITGLTTGVGHIHYVSGKPAIYGIAYSDFKSLITTDFINNRVAMSLSTDRMARLRSALEEGQSNDGLDAGTSDRDTYTYQNFLMQASQRAVLQLISSIEGSISVKYPDIDTNVYDGMPCWFIKDGDMFIASCTAPTITWSSEGGASTEYSVVNIRSIKTCLELVNKPMSNFKELIDLKPFFSTEGVLTSKVLDWRDYCYYNGVPFKEMPETVFAMSSRDFAKAATFIYDDPTNIADWARTSSELFSEISYPDYKYILPQPYFSSTGYYIENVKSIDDVYNNFPTEGFFYENIDSRAEIPPFIYRGIGDNEVPGQTTKSLVAGLKTFINSVKQLPPYNIDWWSTEVVKNISKVIWE